jgi:hypothetical protein
MALSTFQDTPKRTPEQIGVPLYRAVKVYAGGLVCINTAHGFGVPGSVATTLIAMGIACATTDNTSGSDGALTVNCDRGIFRLKNYAGDLVPATQRGQPCFIYDDGTVAATNGSAARSVAGTVLEVDSQGVWVEIGSVNGTSLAAEIAAREALAADLGSSTGTTLAGVLKGLAVAVVGDANVVGGLPVLHRINIADGTTGDVDVVLTHKTLVTKIWLVKKAAAGGSSDTITVKNTATAISDAMSINVADKVVVNAGTIDDAQATISAGGTLRVTRTKASSENVACEVYVLGVRVA